MCALSVCVCVCMCGCKSNGGKGGNRGIFHFCNGRTHTPHPSSKESEVVLGFGHLMSRGSSTVFCWSPQQLQRLSASSVMKWPG